MIKKVKDILETLNLPVGYIIRPKMDSQNTVLSYHFYNYSYAYYGDGKGKDFSESLQVDIFYRRDIGNLEKQIIDLFESHGFRFGDSDEYIEDLSGIRLYHKVLSFNYLESEVL